jgi:transcriptional regulator with XRE-family HTH domain
VTAWAIIREARSRAGLTQRALAERAGKAQSEIAKIERGRRDPSVSTLERLVRAAGFDLKIELVPRDEHDERLIEDYLRLTPKQRLAAADDFNEFLSVAEVVDDRGNR